MTSSNGRSRGSTGGGRFWTGLRACLWPGAIAALVFGPWAAPARADVPVQWNGQWTGAQGRAVTVDDRAMYAYVASNTGLEIVSTATLQRVGGWDAHGRGLDVVLLDQHVYLGLGGDVAVLDVAMPSAPVLLTMFPVGGSLEHIRFVPPNYLAVTAASAGLQIVDISNPGALHLEGAYVPLADGLGCLAVEGSYAYIAPYTWESKASNAFEVIDISNPANPYPVASVPFFGIANDAAAAGSFVYVAADDVIIMDVARPYAPLPVALYPLYQTSAYGVTAPCANYAYVALRNGAVLVLDVRDPYWPRLVGQGNTGGVAWDIWPMQSDLYVAAGSAGLVRLRTAILGDVDCSCSIDFDDITPFVLALSNPIEWQYRYPNCNLSNADINGDGRVDFDDINPFVALLSGS